MSILLSHHIKSCLSANSGITDKVGSRIYPYVATQGAPQLPFIVYNCEITSTEYDKGVTSQGDSTLHRIMDSCSIAVHCVVREHDELLSLMELVRNAVECSTGEYATYYVSPCEMTSALVDFDQELPAFDGVITFETTTNY